ncbi:hypothetical protein AMQ84_02265 [Paenibacillus riograndensis]|uniref:Ig-like domain-containing protein n=1 Tax=Paenibacillus riograndensis TaxID=483937 RepID=A0A132UAZ2_9BACL|nr:hypothetical protein [Paenibacillus riograndensis]KWX80829.1 hypothetical protein AMQ84_02265 [Paenibacillus riograndensis]
MSRRAKKYTALSLILSMLLSLIPGSWSGQAAAAGKDIEVVFKSGAHIGNLSYPAENTFVNFYNNQVEGFTQTETDKDARYDWAKGDIFAGVDDNEATVRFQVNVADNPILREMAKSGHAEMLTGFNILRYHSGFGWTRVSHIGVWVDGVNILPYSANGSNVYNKSASAMIKPNSVIEVMVYGEGDDDGEAAGVRGFYLKFQDLQRPVLNSYTFTGNGAERTNETIKQEELFVKKEENITLSYNFSEPVSPTNLVTPLLSEPFFRQPLFVSEPETGLPAAGEQQYLENTTYNKNNLKEYYNKIAFQYVGKLYHSSGNLPLEPKITGTTAGGALIDRTLEEKFKDAGLADAAGNLATISFPNVGSSSSNKQVQGKNVNPFDYKNGGYRVIVDAVRPKYTKVGNGIQPEILTGSTLNKGDVIDFTVQMTEEVIVKQGWDVKKTFLYFNNGMKAYYTGGSNTKNWKFSMTVPGGTSVEAPLLKVIALSNDSKGDSSDINVIQDYAGNLLVQPANYDGNHSLTNEPGDISKVYSKIDNANLSIDNTKPVIGYRYEAGGGSNTTYQKKGKVTIDANDPAVRVPNLDPIPEDKNQERPSRGIYRPSNMTGETSPSVGLVYYLWSRSSEDPFASKAEDHYAALKRYSLAAKQPSEELYPGAFQNIKLSVANNKTNLLTPPAEAFTPEMSGEWYLHTWTADMTWDTARELKQYELMKKYKAANQAQYDAWIAEAPGSEDDKIFNADNKALEAVGQYGDLNTWPLDLFKQDDSNWTHEVGILKLDNQAPAITKDDGSSTNNTNNVTVSAVVQDPHSGVGNVKYQWVKEGNQPVENEWKAAAYSGSTVTQSTYEDVSEDGNYWLYLKAVDKAGNEIVDTATKNLITVNSQDSIPAEFTPASNPDYEQNHDVTFRIGGIKPDFVGYAIDGNSNHPEDSAFTELSSIEPLESREALLAPAPTQTPSPAPAENTGSAVGTATPQPTAAPAGSAGSGGGAVTPQPTPSESTGAGGGAVTPQPSGMPAPTSAPDALSGTGASVAAGPFAMAKLLAAGPLRLGAGSFQEAAAVVLEETAAPATEAPAATAASTSAPASTATDAPAATGAPSAEASAAPSGTAAPKPEAAADPQATPTAAPGKDAAKLLKAPEDPAMLSYLIPANTNLNGTQYIHMIVKQGDKSYYYTKAYYFDNTPPMVGFDSNGVSYPLPSVEVKVSVEDLYSKKGLTGKYQWLKDGAAAPDSSSPNWSKLPDSGNILLDGAKLTASKELAPGEVADYRLYVYAVDGAGNGTVSSPEGSFKISAVSKEAPPAEAKSALVFLSGDTEDGYTAIVKLSLETEDKTGYEYSVSSDNGLTWVNWRPYTNFVSLKAPSGDPSELNVMVKYRTPGGKISDPLKVDVSGKLPDEAPVYALATLSSNGPVNAAAGVNVDISLPAGIKVMLSKSNPSTPVRTGNSFNVKENGFYSFELFDLNDAKRTDTLYVVVKNVDGTIPRATVKYSQSLPTNNNVTAILDQPSEDIIVTNNNGKMTHTFTGNGTFTFEFKDAAGNTGSAEAVVNIIDKEAPKVKVVRSYQFGTDGSKRFGTLLDSNGNVVLSSGVTLEVQKADDSSKQIFVTSQDKAVSMTQNGVVSFTVSDQYGNTTVIKENVTHIVTTPPEVENIAYTFVDEDGKALAADKIVTIGGKKFAQGKVKVTITGKTAAPNMVFSGLKPMPNGGTYSNKISGADGTFTYTRLFESNGPAVATLSDALGNANKIPVTVTGLDNKAPELSLKQEVVGIVQNKKDFVFGTDLGGYTVSDNVSAPGSIKVAVSGLDLKKPGRQRVTYTATDEVGNTNVAYQDVVVVKDGGLLIFGDNVLISASSGESALFESNTITFKVTGYNVMKVAGADKVNEAGTFDILYQPGLYREGQMKSIAAKITYQQLVSGQYKVTFPKAGWYTIIVRTQERDREYATFFVGSTK